MGLITVTLSLDLTKGVFVGTELKDGKLQTCPKMLTSTYPLDINDWEQHGGGVWSMIGNDKVVINNINAGNYYLDNIYEIAQAEAKTVHFRLTVDGEGIQNHDGFSIKLILTDVGGLSGTKLGESLVRFPAGNFTERQIEVSVTPTAPARYLYAYIFTRYKTGKITMWNAEIWQDDGPQKPVGIWKSRPFDLAKESGIPITKGSIPLKNAAFKYGNIANVDNMDSVDYSIDALSKFDIVVTHEPGILDSRQTTVLGALATAGVKVFGYAVIGSHTSSEVQGLVTLAKAIIDRCSDAGYAGVFFDCFGYDWNVTRAFQNDVINYAHSKSLKVFANSWRSCLDSTVNAISNPTGTPTAMSTDDWVLFEGFYSYVGDDEEGYAGDKDGFASRFMLYSDIVSQANQLGVNVCGLADALSTIPLSDISDWVKAYCLATGLGMHGLSYSQPISEDVVDWPLSAFVAPKIGSKMVSLYVQIDTDTYEAKTDEGVVQFIATDNPVSRGYRSFSVPPKILVAVTLPEINAQVYKVAYYSSPDQVTWNKVTSLLLADRFLRVEIKLRN